MKSNKIPKIETARTVPCLYISRGNGILITTFAQSDLTFIVAFSDSFHNIRKVFFDTELANKRVFEVSVKILNRIEKKCHKHLLYLKNSVFPVISNK